MMLCILAIFDTDDVWIVAATVVAIGLIALTIAIELWRVLAASGDDAATATGTPTERTGSHGAAGRRPPSAVRDAGSRRDAP
jgi:hypothetical protein